MCCQVGHPIGSACVVCNPSVASTTLQSTPSSEDDAVMPLLWEGDQA